jgi:kynureninase
VADEVAAQVAAVQDEFDAEVTYLDTATLGLPPRRTVEAVTAALDAWRRGTSDAVGFDAAVEGSRESYARLVGVGPVLGRGRRSGVGVRRAGGRLAAAGQRGADRRG